MTETPSISASNYANASYGTNQLMGNAAFISNSARAVKTDDSWKAIQQVIDAQRDAAEVRSRRVIVKDHQPPKGETIAMPSRRIVQVYIADPDDAVPLADSILYTSDQKMTDLNDQELFFEIDIKGVLEAHNAKRIKIVDKEVKDRTEYLEPAKVRDLKMVVVTVASF